MGQPFHFYADRPAGEIRTADDVDLPAEILNYAGYREYLKIHFQALWKMIILKNGLVHTMIIPGS